jgi:pimeloyl-ACP methyl ester carboxylesterase
MSNSRQEVFMRHVLRSLFSLIAFALALPAGAQDEKVGVVLLHGKQGAPSGAVASLARKMTGAGFLVATPEMPWSRNRIYGASYEDAMAEIDEAAEGLRKKGARNIVIGGHSLGGNAAVGYASRHDRLAGLIVLAPGHFPDLWTQRDTIKSSVAHAKEMVAAGNGDSIESFADFNMGKTFYCHATAKVYLSYLDPDGPAVIPKNAAAIRSPMPILWVVGSRDPATRPSSYAFDKAPAHPKSRYLAVDAEHVEVPAVAADQVVMWLRSLDQ